MCGMFLFIIVKVYWKRENNSTASLINVTKLLNMELSQKISKKINTEVEAIKENLEFSGNLQMISISRNLIWNFSPNSRNYLRL